jgi:Uma2 family endonuclease
MASLAPAEVETKHVAHGGHIDRSRPFRLADLAHFPSEDGLRYEILAGELVVSPAPGRKHGAVACRLIEVLLFVLKRQQPQWCLMAQPINLQLESGETTYHCEPDLSIFDRPLETVVADETLLPVIVVEIVSPGNPENDYVRKVEAYAAFGIPEYWIVDPGNQGVTFLALVETVQGSHFTSVERSGFLPGVTLEPTTLFAGLTP